MPASPSAVVVGTNFGARIHGRALQRAGYDVVGLVGRDPEKTRQRAEKAGLGRAFVDLEEALKLKPAVVVVATPPHTHADLVAQALDGGAHVVCEKPFTLDQGRADALLAQSEKAGLIGLIGHEFRYAECAAAFGRLLAEGAIGEPRLATFVAHSSLVADTARPMPEWWFDADRGGGWLAASGSHAVDRVRDWYGEVVGVSARLLCVGDRPAGSADDTFDVRFATASGVTGVLQSTGAAWGEPVSVTKASGTAGALWIHDRTAHGSVEGADGDVFVADCDGVRKVAPPHDLRLDLTGLDPSYALSVAAFAQLYRDLGLMIEGRFPAGRRPRPATFADGCAAMRVLDAIRASSAQGGAWISLG